MNIWLKYVWLWICAVVVGIAGCGVPLDPSGGAGGVTQTPTGGAGGQSATTTSTSNFGGTGGVAGGGSGGAGGSPENPIKNGDGVDGDGCYPIAPAANEDGTYARIVFGPWVSPWEFAGVRFLVQATGETAVTNPWTMATGIVPPGVDPAGAPCSVSTPRLLTVVDEWTAQNGNVMQTLATDEMPMPMDPGGYLVVCLRNTVNADGAGHPTGITICGEAGTGTPADQWEALNGEQIPMCSYGATFCRPWAVELIDAAAL
jgi:hypothetical protein